MNLTQTLPLSVLGLAFVGMALPAAMRDRDDDSIPLKDARLRIEFNATAEDVGIQADIDGEPWKSLTIKAPNGKKILDVKGKGNLGKLGMTELFFESHEPSFDEMSLADVLALFPEGTYEFSAISVDGTEQEADVEFTHAIPAGPIVLAPVDGSTVDPANVVIDWDPVIDPPGIMIVEYQVLVVQVSPKRVFSAHVPSSVTSLTIPPEFFLPGHLHQFEVLAIEAGGNQTITEAFFSTP